MYRITNVKNHIHGSWYVMPEDNYKPTRIDNPNLFFDTRKDAAAKCRELNH